MFAIPERERERLAIHNLYRIEDCKRKIAALLNCDADEAITMAEAARKTYVI